MLLLLGCHLFSSPDIATCDDFGGCDTGSADDTGHPTGGDDTDVDTGEAVDVDGDGAYRYEDCDDDNDQVSPYLDEVCGDGLDNDCDGGPNDCLVEGELTAEEAVLYVEHTSGEGDEGVGMDVAMLGDVDGDGVGEIAVGVPYSANFSGVVSVYGVDQGDGSWTEGEARLYSDQSVGIGQEVASVGDLDGDGIDDVVVAMPYWSEAASYAGAVAILYGPVSGDVELSGAVLLEHDDDYAYMGDGLTGGEVTGDSGRDLIVGGRSLNGGLGGFYVVEGDDIADRASPESVAKASITHPGPYSLSAQAGKPADIDGDGVGDLVLSSPYDSDGIGMVYVLKGPLSGDLSTSDADASYKGPQYGYLGDGGTTVVPDTNGDGLPELAIGAYYATGDGISYAGRVYVLAGLPGSGEAEKVASSFLLGASQYGLFGFRVAGAELNGDGVGDIAVSAVQDGEVYVFYGPLEGAVSTSEAPVSMGFAGGDSNFGIGLDAADSDGDGVAEILVGAPYAYNGRGAGLIYDLNPL